MTCKVARCDRRAHARGMCTLHYQRWQLHGDPEHVAVKTGRPLLGEHPTWAAIHKRLTRQLGPARLRPCVDCGQGAAEWSYDGRDPDQLQGVSGGHSVPYSLDLGHYDPRCVSCHRKYDGAGQRPRNSVGQFAVADINEKGTTR